MTAFTHGPVRDTRADYLKVLPVGSWWFEYGGSLIEHRLGILTPDIDMLSDTHRYTLCGRLVEAGRPGSGCPCMCKSPATKVRHCQRCARAAVPK